MLSVRTGFKPQQHGFQFANRFDILPSLQIGKGRSIDLGDIIIGLCGGMCFTALDYFHQGLELSSTAQVEEITNLLLRRLRKRQKDSVPLRSLKKILAWALKDDLEVAKLTASRELPRLRDMLERGEPAVLAIIRTKGLQNPTLNHQVIATGYDYDPDRYTYEFTLYDPNHPGKEPRLRLDISQPTQGARLSQSTGEPLRGFFLMNYKPRPLFTI